MDIDQELLVTLQQLRPQDIVNIELPPDFGSIKLRRLSDPAAATLAAILRQDTRLEPYLKLGIRSFGTWSCGSCENIAGPLAISALENGPNRALEEYRIFLRDDSILGREILATYGVRVLSPHQIDSHISIVPFIHVSSTSNPIFGVPAPPEVRTFGPEFPSEFFDQLKSRFGTITSALVASVKSHPKFVGLEHPIQAESKIGELEDLHRIITICCSIAPVRVAHWIEIAKEVPLRAMLLGGGAVRHYLEEYFPFDQPAVLEESHIGAIRAMFKKFNGLTPSIQMRLRLATDRINSACRQRSFENAFIDLGIALEVTLAAERAREEPISHLIAQRGAWLLAKNESVDVREMVFQRLKKLYGFRSDAAHAGTMKWSPKIGQEVKL